MIHDLHVPNPRIACENRALPVYLQTSTFRRHKFIRPFFLHDPCAIERRFSNARGWYNIHFTRPSALYYQLRARK